MSEHLDKHIASPTPIAGAIRLVLTTSGIRTDPSDRSDQCIVSWAMPMVEAVAERVFPPRHMDGEDLRQEIWLGVIQALKTYDPGRGSLRYWVARHALQRAYDAVRWAARHEDELAAVEVSEVDALLEDLSTNPEDLVLRRQPRQRLARYAAKLVQSASEAARMVLRELMAEGSGATLEDRLAAIGFSSQQVDHARTELRALGFAAMRQVISENRFVFARRRP